jgi:hypothetical protein
LHSSIAFSRKSRRLSLSAPLRSSIGSGFAADVYRFRKSTTRPLRLIVAALDAAYIPVRAD